MSTIQIVFEVPTDSLPQGGTFQNPTAPSGLGHPPITVSVDGGVPVHHAGDYQVPVGTDDTVMIWCEDSARRATIVMAPVRFLAHTWAPGSPPGTPVTVTESLMGSPEAPISSVEFFEDHADLQTLVFASGGNAAWQQSQAPFWSGLQAGSDVEARSPRVYQPYLRFGAHDNLGLLSYGLEFTVLENNTSKGYFWFDPFIKITR